jgi:predicted transglutaminase-like cysteine proteinase
MNRVRGKRGQRFFKRRRPNLDAMDHARKLWLPVIVLAVTAGASTPAGIVRAAPLAVTPPIAQQAHAIEKVARVRRQRTLLTLPRRNRHMIPDAIRMRHNLTDTIAEPVKGPNHSLFGTTEVRSSKLTAFHKWNGAMARMAAEQASLARFKQRFGSWVAFLDTLKGQDPMAQLRAVNTFMNRSPYIQDIKNWGVRDYWESPGQFLAKFGDCEDYGIAKYMALKYLGFKVSQLRVVVLKDVNLNIGHAILAVYYDDRILILDNQIKAVADSRRITHYRPVYSINEQYWWRHRPRHA